MSELQKPETGVWTLVAPSGARFVGPSPLAVCGAEQQTRIPAEVAVGRIISGTEISEYDEGFAAGREVAFLEAAERFEGAKPFNWVCADGYSNGLDIAGELRFMAAEANAERRS